MTSWKVKGKYVSEPLNFDMSHNDHTSTSGKNKSLKSQKPIFHKSAEELIAKKRLMNARYKKNLKERKRFWKNKEAIQNLSSKPILIPFKQQQAFSKPISKPTSKPISKIEKVVVLNLQAPKFYQNCPSSETKTYFLNQACFSKEKDFQPF